MKRLLIVLLLLAPVALPGLAHASPPDPTWIHGIYDDDDGDSVVTLIASGTGLAPAAPSDPPFLDPLIARLTPTPERMPLRAWAQAAPSRAPPAR
jgi:hypothetical protein